MNQTAIISAALAIAMNATSACAGPFGLTMGMAASDLSVITKGDNGEYSIKVPKPNSEFQTYTATAGAKTGLCKVVAVGRTKENDKTGAETMLAYERLRADLIAKYGNGRADNVLQSGAQWNRGDEWSASIYYKERTVAYVWDPGNSAGLPPDIGRISLEVRAAAPFDPFVQLSYEFANFSKCSAATPEQDKDAL